MIKFLIGLLIGVMIVLGVLTVYSLAEMAHMYDRSVDRWFDDGID